MVGRITELMKGESYPAITIPSLMLSADLVDRLPFMLVFFRIGEPLLMVVIGASGDVRNSQKQR